MGKVVPINNAEALRALLEGAVRDILSDPQASTADKLRAIEHGCHLLQLRLKFSDRAQEAFFPGAS